MANTLIPIQTYTLTSTASSVVFSNIPQNYTDVKVVISARTARANIQDSIQVQLNSDSAANYKYIRMYATGAAVATDTDTIGSVTAAYVNGGTGTASTFGSCEFTIFNYAGSAHKAISSEGGSENNSTNAYFATSACRWASTAAVTSISIQGGTGSNFSVGSTFTLYGVSNGVKATGGTLTVAGGYAYHTFTSTGSFLPNQRIKNAEVLCVAGGGGGGSSSGGGGGAGGVLYGTSINFSAGTTYTALVGAGSANATNANANGSTGNDSVINGLVSKGGGYGGAYGGVAIGGTGGSGGGGGQGAAGGSASQSSGGTNYVVYGNNGGTGGGSQGSGGGGAGAVGTTSSGGIGTTTFSSWHAITGTGVLSTNGLYHIAGGGGGASYPSGTIPGGTGGGGTGGQYNGSTNQTAGTANTGGGGGGAANSGIGQGGGSGLIIVRYPLS